MSAAKFALSYILLVFLSVVSYQFAVLTLSNNQETLQWIADGRAGKKANYFNQYSAEYIQNLEDSILVEQKRSHQIKSISFLSALLLTILFTIILFKVKWRLHKFDGLSIFVFNFLLIFIFNYLFIYGFEDTFKHSPNARKDLALAIEIGLVLSSGFIQLLAFWVNQKEVKMGFHKAKWISVVSIILAILFFIIGFITLAFVFSDPLAGNWG